TSNIDGNGIGLAWNQSPACPIRCVRNHGFGIAAGAADSPGLRFVTAITGFAQEARRKAAFFRLETDDDFARELEAADMANGRLALLRVAPPAPRARKPLRIVVLEQTLQLADAALAEIA